MSKQEQELYDFIYDKKTVINKHKMSNGRKMVVIGACILALLTYIVII